MRPVLLLMDLVTEEEQANMTIDANTRHGTSSAHPFSGNPILSISPLKSLLKTPLTFQTNPSFQQQYR